MGEGRPSVTLSAARTRRASTCARSRRRCGTWCSPRRGTRSPTATRRSRGSRSRGRAPRGARTMRPRRRALPRCGGRRQLSRLTFPRRHRWAANARGSARRASPRPPRASAGATCGAPSWGWRARLGLRASALLRAAAGMLGARLLELVIDGVEAGPPRDAGAALWCLPAF
ncbi:MAG: hypothetical protein J3K34DRAFT_495203, partial [Monoraphidium minutum]